MNNSNLIKAGRKNGQKRKAACSHWVIEGQPFENVAGAYAVALRRGATVTLGGFRERLRAGDDTWAQLVRPSDNGDTTKRVGAFKANKQRKRDEMAELIAALDQRKRDMGLGD